MDEPKKRDCSDCKYFICDESYDSESGEEYVYIECEKEHGEHVGFGQDPCEDFEEDRYL